MNNKERYFFQTLLALVLGFALILAWAGGAHAKADIRFLEVTGILKGIDESVVPNEITLEIDGEPASGALSEICVFMDERESELSREIFVERYIDKIVTLQIYEHNEEVFSCKAGR